MEPADQITDRLHGPIIADLNMERGEKVLLFVNGMGGTPLSELYIVYGHARARLEEAGYEVARTLVGNYITALEMQGCSLTVLRLDEELTEIGRASCRGRADRWG